MNKHGSALLFCTLMFSFMGVLFLVFCRSNTLYYTYAIEREQAIRARWALDALMEYAIACQMRNVTPKKSQLWPAPIGPYKGKIALDRSKESVNISASLSKDRKNIDRAACRLVIPKTGPKKVDQWRYL